MSLQNSAILESGIVNETQNRMLLGHRLNLISENVYVTKGSSSELDNAMIEFLKNQCRNSKIKRCRVNFHTSDNSLVHEMMLCMNKETKIQPHSHKEKDESFHIIERILGIALLTSNRPCISKCIYLNSSGGPYFVRIPAQTEHLIVPITDYCVVHETTNGPFRKNEASIAQWSLNTKGADMVEELRYEVVKRAPASENGIKGNSA